jgi:hypothetical protein
MFNHAEVPHGTQMLKFESLRYVIFIILVSYKYVVSFTFLQNNVMPGICP